MVGVGRVISHRPHQPLRGSGVSFRDSDRSRNPATPSRSHILTSRRAAQRRDFGSPQSMSPSPSIMVVMSCWNSSLAALNQARRGSSGSSGWGICLVMTMVNMTHWRVRSALTARAVGLRLKLRFSWYRDFASFNLRHGEGRRLTITVNGETGWNMRFRCPAEPEVTKRPDL